jgi:hypothetical protein
LPRLAWTTILLFCASNHGWDDRHMPQCPAVFGWDGVLQAFLPNLAWNCHPPHLSLCVAWDDRCVCPAIGWDGGLVSSPSQLALASQVLANFFFNIC